MLGLSLISKAILEGMNAQVYLKELYSADTSVWPILWHCGYERDKKENLYRKKVEKSNFSI